VVAIVDINPERLEIARSFGFQVLGVSLDDGPARRAARLRLRDRGDGQDAVAERAIDAVIRGGKLLLFGVCPPDETAGYSPFKIYNEEITVIGSMAVLRSYGPAIDLLAAGGVDTDKMVTHTFPIDQFDEAVALVRAGGGLKVQVTPNG
jgi:NADPH2:quinone reductase